MGIRVPFTEMKNERFKERKLVSLELEFKPQTLAPDPFSFSKVSCVSHLFQYSSACPAQRTSPRTRWAHTSPPH